MNGINYSQVKDEWKEIHLDIENLEQLYAGIQKLRDVVAGTMGSKGRTVILHNASKNEYVQTKDGVSVAKSIYLKDTVENIGANLVKTVAENVVKAAGDGTTTATVFTASLVGHCIDLIKTGEQAYDIVQALDRLHEALKEHFNASVRHIENERDVRNIARIASNSDEEITDLIVRALNETGEETVINLEHGNSVKSYIEHTKGYSIDRGYLNHNFKDPNRISIEYRNPLIFITKEELVGTYDVEPVMRIAEEENRPLVIIAKDFLQDAYNYITMNKLHKGFPVLPIKAPRHAEEQTAILEDLAIYTNANLMSKDTGFAMSMIELEDLGSCDLIKSGTDYTHIFGGHHNQMLVNERVEGIREKLVDTVERDKHEFFIKSLKERISKLTDGICTIHVGGFTPQESKEKFDRVEDSLLATTSALEHGYIVGGGLFYRRVGAILLNEREDSLLLNLAHACFAPYLTILKNAMLVDSKVHDKTDQHLMGITSDMGAISMNALTDYNVGVNATTGDIEDFINVGIIDAAKATETIIDNAIAFAKTFITTHATVVHRIEYFQNIQ